MYHGITFFFNDGSIPINTWDAWNLAPSTRPVINPPKMKTQVVEIPSGSGSIDLSTSLTGYPLYENRQGTIEFIVVNDTYEQADIHNVNWSTIYSDIMGKLNGQYLKAVLEDDPDWFYEGRFTVDSWKSEQHYSLVTIGYDLKPYKWSIRETVERYDLADYAGYQTAQADRWYYNDDIGNAPINPTFKVENASAGIKVTCFTPSINLNKSRVLQNGNNIKVPEFVLWNNPRDSKSNSKIEMESTTNSGVITISFRRGML